MPPPPPPHHYDLLTPLVSAAVAFILVLITAMVIIYRKITRKKAVLLPTESPTKQPLQRFSQSLLSRATGGFSAANRIGKGGFGSVYKGVLQSGQEVAVKLMNNASIQGEREFQNEISLVTGANTVSCPYIVSLLGFATWDCDKDWNLRWIRDTSWMFFSCSQGGEKDDKSVVISGKKLALVYEYMQNGSLQDGLLDGKCVELNCWKKRFNVIMCVAKGLEYLHSCCDPPIIHGDVKPSNVLLDSNFNAKIADFGLAQKLGKVDEETAGIFVEEDEKIGDDYINMEIDDHVVINVDQSPEKKTATSLRSEALERSSSVLELGVFEEKRKCDLERDWWWKQENVKGYVMEWINKDSSPKKDWIQNLGSIDNPTKKKRKKKKKLQWWASLDREALRSKADRKPREWWKEEFCDELSKKKKKRGGLEDQHERKKKQSRTSIDRSIDSISSTPSMRGTICYIAPECRTQPSDKCDVYSFGVLLLVVVSGRRPLQVTASPLSEFERANLISWARQLALGGRLMDLVDPKIRSLERERAFLCVTVALLCLQRSPCKRPAMREVVGMLSGKCEIPNLPFEFSPSPPSNFPFKTRRRSQ